MLRSGEVIWLGRMYVCAVWEMGIWCESIKDNKGEGFRGGNSRDGFPIEVKFKHVIYIHLVRK